MTRIGMGLEAPNVTAGVGTVAGPAVAVAVAASEGNASAIEEVETETETGIEIGVEIETHRGAVNGESESATGVVAVVTGIDQTQATELQGDETEIANATEEEGIRGINLGHQVLSALNSHQEVFVSGAGDVIWSTLLNSNARTSPSPQPNSLMMLLECLLDIFIIRARLRALSRQWCMKRYMTCFAKRTLTITRLSTTTFSQIPTLKMSDQPLYHANFPDTCLASEKGARMTVSSGQLEASFLSTLV